MRIDAHVHYTPPSMAENLEAFSEQEPYWGLLITPDPVNHTAQGWATGERMIADMDRAGIDKVALLGVYRQTYESSQETNNDTLALMRQWPDRVLGFAVATPHPLEKAIDELKRCIDAGMVGVGELNPYGQGISLDDPGFLKMVETCIEYDVPLNLHVSEEIGHFYLGKSTTPLIQYYRLACRYPELKLVLAHWGGGLFFYEIMPEVRKNLKNVWYDTAGTPLIYPTPAIFKIGLQCVDARKVLYGSDYPLLIMPKRQQEPDFCLFLEEIDTLGLDRAIYANIMGRNAARLFGFEMEEPQGAEEPLGEAAQGAAQIITEIANPLGLKVQPYMAVQLIAETWPQTQAVFEKYGIPWKDSPVPFWEPLAQAAAAHGLGPKARQGLLNELNESILTVLEN